MTALTPQTTSVAAPALRHGGASVVFLPGHHGAAAFQKRFSTTPPCRGALRLSGVAP